MAEDTGGDIRLVSDDEAAAGEDVDWTLLLERELSKKEIKREDINREHT